MACCNPSGPVGWGSPAGCPPPASSPCPEDDPAQPDSQEGPACEADRLAAPCPARPEESCPYVPNTGPGPGRGPAALPAPCPARPEESCPHVPDTGPGPGRGPAACPRRPGLQTAQQFGLQHQMAHHRATGAALDRAKYETLPDHLNNLAVSEILASDRFKSTAAESFTFKRRDRCLNPEPIFSPAPPCDSVTYLKEMEERVTQSTLLPSRPRFSEYAEAYHPHRLSCADMVGQVKLKKPCHFKPSTDILPRHFYTATGGVAGEVNPLLSTTQKDFQPVLAEAARRYRDAPSSGTFTGDAIMPQEAALQPRWHGFTPTVPHTGLQSEAQARFCRPRLVSHSRHSRSAPVEAPLVIPPTTHQLLGEAQFERESDNYGSGRHNPVAVSSRGLASQQQCRRQLCNLGYDELQAGRPACRRAGPPAARGAVHQVGLSGAAGAGGPIRDNHFGETPNPPPRVKPDLH